jgi:predicted TIM-barrel fold metal-dependent hydrolase
MFMKANQQVNTREPYRIDVHHHVLPEFYLAALERIGRRTIFGVRLPDWSLDAHLEVMDRIKIAVGMASIPMLYHERDAFGRGLARQCNEFLASMRSEHPTRFGAFASLPLPDVDGALEEATYALDTLLLDGIVMASNVEGHYVGDAENDELFAELNRRSTVVYIHPSDPPDQGIPDSIRYPIDTAMETVRAAMSLLFGGVFERYPNLRFIFSHCGGITPYLAQRMVRGRTWIQGEGGPDPGLIDPEPDSDEAGKAMGLLQRQYYDSMTANGHNGLRTLQDFVGPAHIVFGTDHAILPAKYQSLKMRELMRYKGFDEAERLGVERENTLRLFPRLLEVL